MDSLTVVSFEEGSNLTKLPHAAFYWCKALETVILPDGLMEIESQAFERCTSLTEITLPSSLRTIRESTFEHCTSLTDITLPSSLTDIYSCAFNRCEALCDVKLPQSVRSIGYSAFGNCMNLTSITLPENLERVDIAAFGYCDNLESMDVPISTQWVNASGRRYGWSIMPKLNTYVFTSGTGYGQNYRNSNGPSQNSYGCQPWYLTRNAEGFNVTFEDGIKYIGSYMLTRSTLNEVTIPASVEETGH